ncbi:hypothetical protein B0H19DRAFT_1063064 [Mycena capillaripes]|nr:hypothetical protein B0H19DRAFT_1063064 [Mycena capillaripes]
MELYRTVKMWHSGELLTSNGANHPLKILSAKSGQADGGRRWNDPGDNGQQSVETHQTGKCKIQQRDAECRWPISHSEEFELCRLCQWPVQWMSGGGFGVELDATGRINSAVYEPQLAQMREPGDGRVGVVRQTTAGKRKGHQVAEVLQQGEYLLLSNELCVDDILMEAFRCKETSMTFVLGWVHRLSAGRSWTRRGEPDERVRSRYLGRRTGTGLGRKGTIAGMVAGRKETTRQPDKQSQNVAQLAMFRFLPTLPIERIILMLLHRSASITSRPATSRPLSSSLLCLPSQALGFCVLPPKAF